MKFPIRWSLLIMVSVALWSYGCASISTPGADPARVAVGGKAPQFTLKDTNGKVHALSQYAGKFVVLEWVNFDCPFVRKHYQSGNMQRLQKNYTGKGVVWFSINSSAPGKQGHFEPDRINRLIKEKGAAPTAYLIDADGQVGRAYGAKATPHMFVISPEGTIIYAGAIDDQPTTDIADVQRAVNFVHNALEEGLAGKPVSVASTKAYGCSVKY